MRATQPLYGAAPDPSEATAPSPAEASALSRTEAAAPPARPRGALRAVAAASFGALAIVGACLSRGERAAIVALGGAGRGSAGLWAVARDGLSMTDLDDTSSVPAPVPWWPGTAPTVTDDDYVSNDTASVPAPVPWWPGVAPTVGDDDDATDDTASVPAPVPWWPGAAPTVSDDDAASDNASSVPAPVPWWPGAAPTFSSGGGAATPGRAMLRGPDPRP